MKFLKYLALSIIILVVIFLGKGLLTPTVSYDCSIVVDKPVEESWAVMSDEATLPKWITGFVKTELISGTANTVGAVSKTYVVENGEEMVMEETITALKPNELMAMTFTMDFMDMDYTLSMKEISGQTHISTNSVTTGNGIIAKSIISFMPDAMLAQEEENLKKLKALIEENTKNYFPEEVIESATEMEDQS